MISSASSDDELIFLSGNLIDFQTQQFIDHAIVKVLENDVSVTQGYTDSFGFFKLQVPRNNTYRIYIYKDNPETLGWDYTSALKKLYSIYG